MKKSLVALAVLGAFAGAASAQSSVTVFGVVDLSANNWKLGSQSQNRMDSNMMNSNRLGVRGVEDLGGGMSANFHLEGGMDNSMGQGGNGVVNSVNNGTTTGVFAFERKSTVGIAGSFGEIRLGRDYTSAFINAATFDVYGANGMATSINLYLGGYNGPAAMGSNANTVVRANNMIAYYLPANLGGFYGSAQVAFGEDTRGQTFVPGDATKGTNNINASSGVSGTHYMGGALGYAAGPINVGVGYNVTKAAAGAGTAAAPFTTDDYKITNVGGSYDFGVVKVLGLWNQAKYGVKSYTVMQLSASIPMGAGEIKASWAKGDAAGGTTGANDATLMGAEYIYNLSKRTALYTQFGQLKNAAANKAGGSFASIIGGGTTNVGQGGIVNTDEVKAGGFKSTGYGVGIRHSF